MTRHFGLIGKGIGYSKSPDIWSEIWERQGVVDCHFQLFDTDAPLETLHQLADDPAFEGVMVTTPYKEVFLPHLNHLSEVAMQVGAVNAIRLREGRIVGYNTDVLGFVQSIRHLNLSLPAVILGSGGASKAVAYALGMCGVPSVVVSRTPKGKELSYETIDDEYLKGVGLIVNTTPLGGPRYPDETPRLPYLALTKQHILYDLSYQEPLTGFLRAAPDFCTKINGSEMLRLQAEEAWRIFTDTSD